MPFSDGTILSANDLNVMNTRTQANMGATYTLTTTQADIGLSQSVTTAKANAEAFVMLTLDWVQSSTFAAAETLNAYLLMNYASGSYSQQGGALFWVPAAASQRQAQICTWLLTLPGAGTYNFKVQAKRGGSTGTYIFGASMSKLDIHIKQT